MRKRKQSNIILEKIEIADVAAGGKAIARSQSPTLPDGAGEGVKKNGMIIFVKGTVPGDVVDLEIFKKKKNYAEGKIIKFHKYSEKREKPFCSHFGTCGGCVWQNLNYEEQLFYKQKQVKEALEHIGKISLAPTRSGEEVILPIVPSKNETYYRNKLEFAFSNKRWLSNEEIKNLPFGQDLGGALGFHVSGLFDKVLDIEHCYLQPSPSNEIRLEIKNYALRNGLSFFDFRTQRGFLRNLIIRNSSLGELMTILVFCDENKEAQENMLNHISEKFPSITSLMYIINPKKNDTIFDLGVHLFKGRAFIYEKLDNLTFKISPKSFFQTNTEQANELYKTVKGFAQIKKNDVVYDLYTGTGTIANFIAAGSKKVIGIDYIDDAIEDARENSQINRIENTEFFAGDIKNILDDDFIQQNGKPRIIITDPPRAGMDEKVVKKILDIEPERIVYVSCNPATQARDIAILSPKYDVKKIQPVDMFPHTHHVESVALLEKRKE